MGIRGVESAKLALRYCAVRRQFATIDGEKVERPVLDYQTTYMRLAKVLCRGMILTVSGMWVNHEFQLMMKDVENKIFTRLDMMHHVLSGFKQLYSSMTLNDAEDARRCCGGAGYQSNSGFTNIIHHLNPIVTYEGENTVMLGQASRFLVKLIKKV